MLPLLEDAEPQDVLEIRRSLQHCHDTRQLNRVLHSLAGRGLLEVVRCEGEGRPKFAAHGAPGLSEH